MGKEAQCMSDALDIFSQVWHKRKKRGKYVQVRIEVKKESRGLPFEICNQMIELPNEEGEAIRGGDGLDETEKYDIEAQIRKEVEGLRPQSTKQKRVQAKKLDVPCCAFTTNPR